MSAGCPSKGWRHSHFSKIVQKSRLVVRVGYILQIYAYPFARFDVFRSERSRNLGRLARLPWSPKHLREAVVHSEHEVDD